MSRKQQDCIEDGECNACRSQHIEFVIVLISCTDGALKNVPDGVLGARGSIAILCIARQSLIINRSRSWQAEACRR